MATKVRTSPSVPGSFPSWLPPVLISVFYLVTHLFNLTGLPVFADEAIYIRWAQLVMDDPHQYLFFALNDGKPPLFIWTLIPFQYLFQDQLFAARIVSVLIGLAQMWIIKEILRVAGARPKTQWFGMILTMILPFWYFHHRMALMDSMLALWMSVAVLGATRTAFHSERSFSKLFRVENFLSMSLVAIGLGLSLWTKLPALFLVPVLLFWPAIRRAKSPVHHLPSLVMIGIGIFAGLLLFATLRISPAFGQLFSRGQDFAYPATEVLFKGKWQHTLPNIPTYITYFVQYLTLPVLAFAVIGLFTPFSRRRSGMMLLAAILFCAPFVLFGKVVYARYFFPVVLFLTLAAAFGLEGIYRQYYLPKKHMGIRMATSIVIASFLGILVTQSSQFMFSEMLNPSRTPFVSSDIQQYLTEWSSGHGLKETVGYIRELAKDQSVAVATEGRFGSLPDGLLLYFHDTDVKNIYIEGTGQYPVKNLPDFFVNRAKEMERSILVVNANRMEVPLPATALLKEYCRPYKAPCLQIWDVTDLVKAQASTSAIPR